MGVAALCGLKDTRHLLGFVVAALGDHPDSVDAHRPVT
jgi:hypothetical protein